MDASGWVRMPQPNCSAASAIRSRSKSFTSRLRWRCLKTAGFSWNRTPIPMKRDAPTLKMSARPPELPGCRAPSIGRGPRECWRWSKASHAGSTSKPAVQPPIEERRLAAPGRVITGFDARKLGGVGGADMDVALRKGDLDARLFERAEQREIKVASDLLRLNLLDVDPEQQLKVETGVSHPDKTHLRRRHRLDIGSVRRHLFHDLTHLFRRGFVGDADWHVQTRVRIRSGPVDNLAVDKLGVRDEVLDRVEGLHPGGADPDFLDNADGVAGGDDVAFAQRPGENQGKAAGQVIGHRLQAHPDADSHRARK